MRPWFFLSLSALVVAAGLSGACGRTPDPVEYFGLGEVASGGTTSGVGGSPSSSGSSGSLGGSGGVGTVIDCGEPPEVAGAFSKRALLEASARCAEWHYCDFDNAATLLQRRVTEWNDDPSDTHRAAARQAWAHAMERWSRVELFQFGPAGNTALDPYHGEAFRERLYSWPSLARCRIEEQIASQRYVANGVATQLPTARGLYALEYLLFYPGSDHGCLSTSSTAQTWSTLDVAEIDARKRSYAAAVSDDVVDVIRELRDRWDPRSGNFRQTLMNAAGYEKAAVDNEQEALNIVAWSFVYIEREVKDWKVAPPAGLNPNAPVNGFETPHAQRAVQALRANLRSFRSLFQGCADGAGLGFDDWLEAAHHADLAEDMIAAWTQAQAAADAFPAFHEASTEDFLALHASVKQLTDLIKNEFLAGAGSPLNLSAPQGLEGDND